MAVLVSVAASVSAGLARVDNGFVDVGDVRDEPNTEAGTIPYAAPGERDSYPGDAESMREAKEGLATDVLAVEWVSRACAPGVHCAEAGASALGSLLDARMILPGAGQFQAWLGTFADLDEDGWIRPASAYDNIHVAVPLGASECQGPRSFGNLRSGESDGIGEAQGFSTGFAIRCPRQIEWIGVHQEIVAYVTPGDWSGADTANRGFEAWDPLMPPHTAGAEAPDLAFEMMPGAPGETTGRYFAPASDVDLIMIDNSLLETTVIEAFSRPVSSIDGDRTMQSGAGSLLDVDVYRALDRSVEALYHARVVVPLAEQGCEVSRPEKGCRAATDPFTEPVRESKDDQLTLAGPALAPFFADWDRDPQAYFDRSEPHAYLDLFLEASFAVSLVKAHSDSDDSLGDRAPFSNSEVSLAGDGRTHATPQTSIMAYFGIWTDRNGDGWIGEPTPSGHCQDAHDCGSRPNPHEYDASQGEFVATCGKHDIQGMAPGADGAFVATLAPVRGTWGLSGVYVLTDRMEGGDARRDPLQADGTAPYDPYDDAVFAPRLVFHGPIEVHMTCTNGDPGSYRSYERLVFPSGSNVEYAFHVSGFTTADFNAQGTSVDETVADLDLVQGWV